MHTAGQQKMITFWLLALAKTFYILAEFGHGPCGHYADSVAQLDPEVDDGNPINQLKFTPVSRRCIYAN